MQRLMVFFMITMFSSMLLAAPLQAQQQVDVPADALAWKDLVKLKDLPKFEVPALQALAPTWQGPPVVLFEHVPLVEMRLSIPAAGCYTIKLAHLAGAGYSALTVATPDGTLGTTHTVQGDATVVLSTFHTSMIPCQYLQLLLTPTQGTGDIGLLYVSVTVDQYDPIKADIWHVMSTDSTAAQCITEQKLDQVGPIGLPQGVRQAVAGDEHPARVYVSGRQTLVAVSHLYHDSAFGGYAFKLNANASATLYINGRIVAQIADGSQSAIGNIPWNKLNRGVNRMVVVMDSGSENRWFELQSSAVRDTLFLSSIPHAVDPRDANMDWPRVTLATQDITAQVTLPDMQKGYYRSVRFDASGQIPSFVVKGKSLFTELHTDRNPLGLDHAAGTAEEFFEPVGFEDAKPGQPFMKIGVGLLRRPLDHDYFFGAAYMPILFFPWQVTHDANSITFIQNGSSPRGAGYHYEKRMIISDNPSKLVIEHKLTNTGKFPIVTSQYSHNFINVDNTPIDPQYQVDLGFKPTVARNVRNRLQVKGSRATPLGKGTIFTPLFGYQNAGESHVLVTHKPTGTKLALSLDQPLYRFWLFASDRVLCPEMFVHIDLSPGQTKRWVSTYEVQSYDSP